ncbi:PQQ-binding-like beta-propeller repeat protein [uncultured Sphingomonas sp.]|uniref:outer membrane protein assembly factor BamB family protein n=1 Tax=uncultured Sphingomonas sp. TaxID=158754 RepID=UPI0037493320
MPTPGAGLTGSNVGFRQNGGVRPSPLYQDGVLFHTIGQNAYAVDARSGRQLWHYIANNTGWISNRGLGISGDTVFTMANGGLTTIDARTGVWPHDSDTRSYRNSSGARSRQYRRQLIHVWPPSLS